MSAERVSTAAANLASAHYVDWCAIILGAFVASAVSMVLFTFGTGIGLSMVSPYEGEGVSRTTYFIALALWTIWIIVSSSVAGGYIAGRLRRRVGDATEHESDMRDGAHGLGVWAVGVVVASLFVALGVAGTVGAAAKVAGPAAAAAASDNDPNAVTLDALFRAPPQNVAVAAEPGELTVRSQRDKAADRAEISRMLATQMVRGEVSADNKTYIASLVAANTGMSQAEAEQRVNQVLAEAKQKADAARKVGVIIAFVTAASLLIGGAAAAWAATLGGNHRDENSDTTRFWRWT